MVRVMVFRMMAAVLFHAIAMLLAALGNSRDDALVLNVVWVVGLNVGSQAVECPLKRIFGGRVHHTWLSREMLVSIRANSKIEAGVDIRIAAHRQAPMR